MPYVGKVVNTVVNMKDGYEVHMPYILYSYRELMYRQYRLAQGFITNATR